MRISDWSSDVCSSDLDLRQHRRRTDLLGADDQAAGAVHRRADHVGTGAFGNGDRFTGQHRLVDVRLAFEHLAVHRHLFAGAYAQAVADMDVAKFNVLLGRSEEHTSELQSLMRISYAVFC